MTTPTSTPRRERIPPSGIAEVHFEGILWKRRDVFKNRWRPRWFVLDEREATLTYYLLQNNNQALSLAMEGEMADEPDDGDDLQEVHQNEMRLRTTSNGEVSAVSELSLGPQNVATGARTPQRLNTSNIVPRGTLYLPGCQIEANPALTRPRENLYCFTVVPPTPLAVSTNATGVSGGGAVSQVHLAARSEETRQSWISKLRHIALSSTAGRINDPITASINMRGGAHGAGEIHVGESDPFGVGQNLRSRISYHASTSHSNSESSAGGPNNGEHSQLEARESSSPPRPPVIQSSFSILSTNNTNPFADELESSFESSNPLPPTTTWCPQSSAECYFENVPSDLQRHVQSTIDEYLPQLQSRSGEEGWKPLSTPEISTLPILQNLTGSMRVMDNKLTIVRTTAEFSKFSPMQVAPILIHHEHRASYEPSCVASHRIRQFNSQTYLDVYHYASFWPRTVACCLHWRCMKKQNNSKEEDSAILIVGTGSKHSSEAWMNSEERKMPALAKYQKNKEANLIVSMVLLERMPCGGTRWSRLVALDPNVPSFAAQMAQSFFVSPQLEQPKAICRLLMDLNLSTAISENVDDRTLTQLLTGTTSTRSCHRSNGIQSIEDEKENGQQSDSTKMNESSSSTLQSPRSPPLIWQTVCLMMPVVMYIAAKQSSAFFLPLPLPFFPLFLFFFSTWWNIRQWVLGHYPTLMNDACAAPSPVASITCKFAVQVKGSLRYITNHKEEQGLFSGSVASNASGHTSVDSTHVKLSMVHIVTLAVAKVWSKHLEKRPRRRTLSVPWLGISKSFLDLSNDVNIALVLPAETRVVSRANQLSVEEIANRVNSKEEGHMIDSDCAVVLAPNPTATAVASPECATEWTASCSGPTEMVVVIGGLAVDKTKPRSKRKPAEPLLNLSVTIRCENAASVGTHVIPELQTLIQFPEMCDS